MQQSSGIFRHRTSSSQAGYLCGKRKVKTCCRSTPTSNKLEHQFNFFFLERAHTCATDATRERLCSRPRPSDWPRRQHRMRSCAHSYCTRPGTSHLHGINHQRITQLAAKQVISICNGTWFHRTAGPDPMKHGHQISGVHRAGAKHCSLVVLKERTGRGGLSFLFCQCARGSLLLVLSESCKSEK